VRSGNATRASRCRGLRRGPKRLAGLLMSCYLRDESIQPPKAVGLPLLWSGTQALDMTVGALDSTSRDFR
jgi:hypothetical protein